MGSGIGGLLLAFPAMFPASATLIEKHERQRKQKKGLHGEARDTNAAAVDALGAAMGSLGLFAFAAICWRCLPRYAPSWVLFQRDFHLVARLIFRLGDLKTIPAFIRNCFALDYGASFYGCCDGHKRLREWLGRHIPVVKNQLSAKHKLMAESPVQFLRGTFYRWAQLFPEVCPDLSTAPAVLAAGDLHIASFGTWRDGFGRLIWGIDDFDEAYPLPYTNDLVRLAVSAILDASEGEINVGLGNAVDRRDSGWIPRMSQRGRQTLCR